MSRDHKPLKHDADYYREQIANTEPVFKADVKALEDVIKQNPNNLKLHDFLTHYRLFFMEALNYWRTMIQILEGEEEFLGKA